MSVCVFLLGECEGIRMIEMDRHTQCIYVFPPPKSTTHTYIYIYDIYMHVLPGLRLPHHQVDQLGGPVPQQEQRLVLGARWFVFR